MSPREWIFRDLSSDVGEIWCTLEYNSRCRMEERPHTWDSNSSRVDPQKVSFDAKSMWDRILVVWISSSGNLFDNHQSLGSLSYSLACTTKMELIRLTIPPFVIANREFFWYLTVMQGSFRKIQAESIFYPSSGIYVKLR